MTLREVFNAISGYTNDKEGLIRTIWESSRFEVMHLLTPHVKPGKKIKALDLATFPWEVKPIDKEKIGKQLDRAQEVVNKWRKSIPRDVK